MITTTSIRPGTWCIRRLAVRNPRSALRSAAMAASAFKSTTVELARITAVSRTGIEAFLHGAAIALALAQGKQGRKIMSVFTSSGSCQTAPRRLGQGGAETCRQRRQIRVHRSPNLFRPANCPWLWLSFACVFKKSRYHPVAPDGATARRLNVHLGQLKRYPVDRLTATLSARKARGDSRAHGSSPSHGSHEPEPSLQRLKIDA
jgi:hypothetical protein